MPLAHPFAPSHFRLHKLTDDKHTWYLPIEPGSYETWLWADEVKICRELGCDVTVHDGWCWLNWRVPTEWRPPLTRPTRPQCKEHTFIYALVDESTQEVRYVGKADDPERRLTDHLRDTKNHVKWSWIQSLIAQGCKPKMIVLEEVGVAVELERERYWVDHYWQEGHNLTNDICRYWRKPWLKPAFPRRNEQT